MDNNNILMEKPTQQNNSGKIYTRHTNLHAHSTWEAQVIQELLNRDPPRAPEDQQPFLPQDLPGEEEEPFLIDHPFQVFYGY
jgi:glucan phosphorylase